MRAGEIVAGRYEVESRTGTGGMGVVYRARDRETSATVALKLVREQEIESVDRFSDEIELLARLEHPNIVGYITHGVSEAGLPYLVMPWLDGLESPAPARVEQIERERSSIGRALRRGCPCVSARARHGPPRSEAEQHFSRRRLVRGRQGPRLRHRSRDDADQANHRSRGC